MDFEEVAAAVRAEDLERLAALDAALLDARDAEGLSLLDVAVLGEHFASIAWLAPRVSHATSHAAMFWAACNHIASLAALRDAGVDLNAYDPSNPHDMTALECAAMSGAREGLDWLAARQPRVRDSLWLAAACGALPRVLAFFTDDGALLPEAYRHRIHPSSTGMADLGPLEDDPQEVLDEALCFAARAGRHDVVDALVERGADVNGQPYYGGPLHHAVSQDSTSPTRVARVLRMVDHLIALGADPAAKDGRGYRCWEFWTDDEELVRALRERG